MKRYVRKFREDKDIIFIRLQTPKEAKSKAVQKKAWNAFPDKKGYEIVYMPWGEKGRGFYYKKEVE